MRGLVLEGGGARGAYHIGVIKALVEKGYTFDGFVGTSIGAVNAASMAQGDFTKAAQLWENISSDQIFDEEEMDIIQLADLGNLWKNINFSPSTRRAASKVIRGRGLNTKKMRIFLETYIDEEKIRRSGKDFGLVTVSIPDLVAHQLMMEDIPRGSLINYIMASASLPGFQREIINKKKYVDGGFFDNMPFNLLINKGYDEIIAIRTGSLGRIHPMKKEHNIKSITPREYLGNSVIFNKDRIKTNINMALQQSGKFEINWKTQTWTVELMRTMAISEVSEARFESS